MGRTGRRGEICRIMRVLLGTFAIFASLLFPTGLNGQQLPDGPKPQNNVPQALPQAPAPQNNAPQAPPTSNQSAQPAAPTTNPPMPGAQDQSNPFPEPASDTPQANTPGPRPNPQVKTIPPGSAPHENTGPRERLNEQLYRFSTQVNAVTVPVTVKDSSGHLVEGLLPKDFSVYENGVKQNLTFFTSDPFPLTAAVVIDMGMPDNVLSKVRDTLPAMIGAFGQFDEVSIFSYGNTVKKWQGFTAPNQVTVAMLKRLKAQHGSAAGAPVVGGPLGQPGPVINGRNVADSTPNMPSMPSTTIRQSRVLNDAILAAARDLAERQAIARRRILFVVSDGREVGSDASYADVMRVLLSNGITVYAVGVGGAGIPGYRQLEKIHIPGLGYGDILPKYASATGGQVFPSFDQQAIETAYSKVTLEARNQYTLGYQTRATPSSAYRSIEVRVDRPGLRIYAKDGYYPLPPRREMLTPSNQP